MWGNGTRHESRSTQVLLRTLLIYLSACRPTGMFCADHGLTPCSPAEHCTPRQTSTAPPVPCPRRRSTHPPPLEGPPARGRRGNTWWTSQRSRGRGDRGPPPAGSPAWRWASAPRLRGRLHSRAVRVARVSSKDVERRGVKVTNEGVGEESSVGEEGEDARKRCMLQNLSFCSCTHERESRSIQLQLNTERYLVARVVNLVVDRQLRTSAPSDGYSSVKDSLLRIEQW